MQVTVRSIDGDDVGRLAELLAERHARHRAAAPQLAPIDASAAVRHAIEEADGGLALTDAPGHVRAYLLWELRSSPVWGSYAWVDRAGHAGGAEALRDLYARAAEDWVAAGVVRHAVVAPAVPELLDPWERLAFARMQVHALQALPTHPPGRDADPRIRAAGADEVDEIIRPLATVIWEHQAATPTFTGLLPPSWDDLRTDWIETLEEDGVVHLVAEEDGAPLGHVLTYPADDELGWPARTVRLAVVAVLPEHRGRGLGRALTEAALDRAGAAGFTHVETDWRVTNLSSSRTWPALGFVPVFHRLWRVTGTG